MKKKKVLSTLLIAGMVASMMVGCGKSADDKKNLTIPELPLIQLEQKEHILRSTL